MNKFLKSAIQGTLVVGLIFSSSVSFSKQSDQEFDCEDAYYFGYVTYKDYLNSPEPSIDIIVQTMKETEDKLKKMLIKNAIDNLVALEAGVSFVRDEDLAGRNSVQFCKLYKAMSK